ncbi:MAG: protein kinase [Verrucomicrobia bacterium]|nr:protein kinase [Verrucomicrobiota bacterium]MBU4290441.1 protein kinase [Verrucomicrobiota bacterium]MBU4428855.1 protein kinase [Verrucomicrobiota bacterium]
MNAIDMLETVVLDSAVTQKLPVPAMSDSAPAKPPDDKTPTDPEFAELVDNYKALIHSRSIPYPVSYQFIKELGHGRQGVVFLVNRNGARGCITYHAVKLFDPGIYSSAAKYWTDMGRIAKQVSLLQPFNNSNLVSCDFYEECNGIGYMLMQAVDGVDLQFLLDGQHLNIARARCTDEEWTDFFTTIFRQDGQRLSFQPGVALHIMRNVLRGLSVLHDNGFVHGDIKPTNIMMDIQGTVKLVDFGRAARIGERVNILLGSPLYMAPEIHRREPGLIQSDLFSAGLVGLEMLQGHQINDLADLNENELQDCKMALAGQIERWLPPDVLKNIEFTHVLKQFLNADAVNRFPTAKDAESGEHSLITARQWMNDLERETEYERKIEAYLTKLVDPETGTLNPHFGSDNLTAVIIM